MAKRRAELRKSEEAWAAYTEKARQDAARYRAINAETLAGNQVAYRAKYVALFTAGREGLSFIFMQALHRQARLCCLA